MLYINHTAHKVSELEKQQTEEAKILHSIQETRGKWRSMQNVHPPPFYVALMSVGELAKGVTYTQSIKTGLAFLHICFSSLSFPILILQYLFFSSVGVHPSTS